ncbi:MAG TPA: hypothetical protein VGM84_21410 [Steroidobacteraceae bacterium]|jgi:hypothetical protein
MAHQSLFAWFLNLDFRKAIWLAPLAWAIHEMEEWNIDAFVRSHFIDAGSLAADDSHGLWISLAIVAGNGIVWTALTSWPRNPRFAAFLTHHVLLA